MPVAKKRVKKLVLVLAITALVSVASKKALKIIQNFVFYIYT